MTNKFFPVSIDLNNKNILVVGAGRVAYSKVMKMIAMDIIKSNNRN